LLFKKLKVKLICELKYILPVPLSEQKMEWLEEGLVWCMDQRWWMICCQRHALTLSHRPAHGVVYGPASIAQPHCAPSTENFEEFYAKLEIRSV